MGTKDKGDPSSYRVWTLIIVSLGAFWTLICVAFPGARELFAALWGFFRTIANF